MQFPSGHSTVFAIVDNVDALAWVANLGCIELHTWHSRVPDIERPDYLLIDLDPTTDGQWPFVREIALVVREVMDELGLRSYPKTSGATGLHILAPIKPELVSRTCGGSRRRSRWKSSGASTTRRSRRRRGVSRPRRRVRRLRPERARPHDRVGVFRSADSRRARVGAASLGRGRAVEPDAFTLETMAARIADVGDPMRGMWRSPPSLRSRFGEARRRASIGFVTPPNTALKSRSLPCRPCGGSSCSRLSPHSSSCRPRATRRRTSATACRTTRGSQYGPGTFDQRLDQLQGSASTSCA